MPAMSGWSRLSSSTVEAVAAIAATAAAAVAVAIAGDVMSEGSASANTDQERVGVAVIQMVMSFRDHKNTSRQEHESRRSFALNEASSEKRKRQTERDSCQI